MTYDLDIIGLQLGVAGYLVNSAQQLPGLDAFLLDPPPSSPRRVFAGVTTWFYRFETEAQWAEQRASLDAPAPAPPPAPTHSQGDPA